MSELATNRVPVQRASSSSQSKATKVTDIEGNVILARWEELQDIKSSAEAELKELRTRVLELHEQGVTLQNDKSRLSVETSFTYTANPKEVLSIVGQETFNAIAEVPAAKLRALMKVNQFSEQEFAAVTVATEMTKVQLRGVKK